MHKDSGKKQNPYIKAIVLLIALIITLFFYKKVSEGTFIKQFLSAFEESDSRYSKYEKIVEFTEAQRDSLHKILEGFWIYSSDSTEELLIDDRMELLDNGYIWRVEQYKLSLPSGRKKNLLHAVHAYMHPSSKSVNDTSQMSCVIRTLNQVWIYDDDTCEIRKYFGGGNKFGSDTILSFIDNVFDIGFTGDELNIYGRLFKRCLKPDLDNFFPPGIIEFVYNLTTCTNLSEERMYTIDRKQKQIVLSKPINSKNVIKLSLLDECRKCKSLKSFLRRAIINDLNETTLFKRKSEDVVSIIRKYFIPFCLSKDDIVLQDLGKNNYMPIIDIDFDLTWQGDLENISVALSSDSLVNRLTNRLRVDAVKREMRKWKFQPLEKENVSCKVSLTDTLK